MAVTMEQLDSFSRFAKEHIQSGEFASWQELFELWVTDFAGPESDQELKRGIEDAIREANAGLGQTFDHFVDGFYQKHSIRRAS